MAKRKRTRIPPFPVSPYMLTTGIGKKMTAKQIGAVVLLLREQWTSPFGRLDNNPAKLAELSRLGRDFYGPDGEVVMQFFPPIGAGQYLRNVPLYRAKSNRANSDSRKRNNARNLEVANGARWPSGLANSDSSKVLTDNDLAVPNGARSELPCSLETKGDSRKRNGVNNLEEANGARSVRTSREGEVEGGGAPLGEYDTQESRSSKTKKSFHEVEDTPRDTHPPKPPLGHFPDGTVVELAQLEYHRMPYLFEALRTPESAPFARIFLTYKRKFPRGRTRYMFAREFAEPYMLAGITEGEIHSHIKQYKGLVDEPLFKVLEPLRKDAEDRIRAGDDDDRFKRLGGRNHAGE